MMLTMWLNSHIKILKLTTQKIPLIFMFWEWLAVHLSSMVGSTKADDLQSLCLAHLWYQGHLIQICPLGEGGSCLKFSRRNFLCLEDTEHQLTHLQEVLRQNKVYSQSLYSHRTYIMCEMQMNNKRANKFSSKVRAEKMSSTSDPQQEVWTAWRMINKILLHDYYILTGDLDSLLDPWLYSLLDPWLSRCSQGKTCPDCSEDLRR